MTPTMKVELTNLSVEVPNPEPIGSPLGLLFIKMVAITRTGGEILCCTVRVDIGSVVPGRKMPYQVRAAIKNV